ncbi:hypothetical protein K9U34_00480 [Lawsonia intracellularis]|uniref:Uncharacterized protein n=1 Tax=Lawsonia intracellularis (strain PHE/MN1-00) TaxID=363253 RepID=Q1MR57_LAWIP|nr:hypothetical protein [Lawsonia intracellularis]AGC49879.1 hypothetical protein LAW_00479 [Lawsonia intracellularis N343]KAA0205378.1 hypothetical protein C4K43_02665 [Lawsonia intracellularis]MBZ3892084.1 hypothetical protein [Lawsonia intracellularis]RBN32073.1 hypothetical protein DR194_03710 [Lawsonia intracellularis]RBN33641.1 hypothetical protein DR192_03725 [Lawsonia intracellularis]
MDLHIITEPLIDLYDRVAFFWQSPKTQKISSIIILVIFLCALASIELNREGYLPKNLSIIVPTNHFRAISLAFTCILCIELIALVLSISQSLSISVGKQLEIMALILLRNAFKELAYLSEPINMNDSAYHLYTICLAAITSLGIFICLGFYQHMPKLTKYIYNPRERLGYINAKKIVALFLLCLLTVIAIRDTYQHLITGKDVAFFETVYTVLIFADILIVLVAQRFMPTFSAIFLHSSSVVATLIMRLSLSANSPWNAIGAMFSGLYILAVTWAITYFMKKPFSIRKNKHIVD